MEDDPDQITPIVVKVLDSIEMPAMDVGSTLSLDDLAAAAQADQSDALAALRQSTPGLQFNWAFPSVDAATLSGMMASQTAEEDADPVEPPSLLHFLEIVPDATGDADQLVEALSAWSEVVEYAYVTDKAVDPTVVATGNPFFSAGRQGYLSAAPDGIDAQAAWAKGADGTATGFIDLEQGWFLDHEDLPPGVSVLQGTNRKTSFAHGCGVLGEIVGLDNATGMVGIVPGADVRVISYNDDLTSGIQLQRVADRIVAAGNALKFGDVLLLEVQIQVTSGGSTQLMPVEADPLALAAIQTITKLGVIVVEAGGNGAVDLDAFTMTKGPNVGKKTLSRSTALEFVDSGAIMVGAAESASSHARASFSNFGSRVDCYAWGENIVTSGWDSAQPNAKDRYWGANLKNGSGNVVAFGGTSGASPIIVGACLLMQHLRDLLTPTSGTGRLGPFGMRRRLNDAANGTASATATDLIGVMPDFAKILTNEFTP